MRPLCLYMMPYVYCLLTRDGSRPFHHSGDTLKFTFTHLSPSTPEKPYSLLIDVAQAAYAGQSEDVKAPRVIYMLTHRPFYSALDGPPASFAADSPRPAQQRQGLLQLHPAR